MTVKISKLEIENTKRVKAVKLEPSANGLTVVGGKNEQGKTSVLDSIAWALGGNRFKPDAPHREGSSLDPTLKVVLDNGLVVERKGKNSDLKVTDPTGKKGGQGLLDSFVEELALNLPKFMESSNKEKANILLQIIGVGDQLAEFEEEEKKLYNDRLYVGRTADQKEKYAKEQMYYPDMPKEPVSAAALISEQQEILAKNGENALKRQKVDEYQRQSDYLAAEIKRMEKELEDKRTQYNVVLNDLSIARMNAVDLHDQSTDALEESIRNIDETNRKVRANLDKEKAEDDAREYRAKYDELTMSIEDIRKQRMDLLNGANMPLEGLSVEDGELTYKGYTWGNMSGSQQLRVATAIVRKLNPECGFVLLDKLEQMDIETMNEFGQWLEEQGLQAIATRVSTGDECSIIIEDGYVKSNETSKPVDNLTEQRITTPWKAGSF